MAKMTIGELVWKINGDKSGFDKAVDQADSKAKGLGSSWKKAGGIIAGALASLGLGALVKKLIDAGSMAEETANKFGVVFAGSVKEATKAANDLAIGFGYSRTEAKGLLSSIGNITQGIGATRAESLKLSKDIITLGSDITSFTNYQGGSAEASNILAKALLGERDALQALDLKVTQAELDNLAKASGTTWNKMTQLQQATMTLDVIQRKAANSSGDFARSIDSYANQSRIAEANMKNIADTLGSAIIPVAGLAAKAFNTILVELDKVAQSVGKFIQSAQGAKIIGDIIGRVAGVFSAWWVIAKPVFQSLKDGIGIVIDALKEVFSGAGDASGAFAFFAGVGRIVSGVIKILANIIGGVVRNLGNLVKTVYSAGKTLASFFMTLAGKGKWSEVSKNISSTKDAVLGLGKGIYKGVSDVVGSTKDLISGFVGDTTKLSTSAAAAYASTSSKFSKAVQSALLANQKNADQTKKSTEQNKSNAESVNKQIEAYKELRKTIQGIGDIAQYITDSIFSMADSIQAIFKTIGEERIAELDRTMQKEMEVAGVSEETTQQKLEREIAAAKAKGDFETQAEKEKELKRFQIQQKYAKKKAKIEYEIAMMQWGFQLAQAIAMAPLNVLTAFTSGMQAPWPTSPGFAAAYAAAAGVANAINIAAIAASKPKPPSFQGGGVVSGTRSSGDTAMAMVNSGEMILNSSQQARLFDMANSGGLSQGGGNMNIYLGNELVYSGLYKASKNGDILIDARSIVSK